MNFEEHATLLHPVERVFSVFRDSLQDLVPHLPSIESIETVERQELGPGKLRLVNHWQANRAVAPTGIRPFATRKLLRWIDVAEWNEAERITDWSFETFHFDKLFDCTGRNRFEDLGSEGTRFVITGSLEVYTERVPGAPKFLARKLKSKVEKFVHERVVSNLNEMAQGVQRLLDSGDLK